MASNRREFIERLGAVAVLGSLPASALASALGAATSARQQGTEWDLSWVGKLKGITHKAIFDCTEIESAYGVWRASIWENQYQSVMGVKRADIRTILILRHHAVALALGQEAWDHLEIGKSGKVMHPVTEAPTDRNPALLSSERNEVPAMFGDFALPKFIARGGIALACNLALQEYIDQMKAKDGVSDDEARKRTLAGLVPGVLLQPSGVFAAMRAGEADCVYVKAS